tara:strand:- start:256 stop:474 length:219 start_codon:yes stop_codon:yes gene_type:complete
MNENEQMSVGDWVITMIIASIPLIGIIMLFVWAFGSDTNLSKKNWAKAILIFFGIIIVIYILILVLFLGSLF